MASTQPRFVPALEAPTGAPRATWFAFRGSDMLVSQAGAGELCRPPQVADLAELGVSPVRWQVLGTLDGMPCLSAELPRDAEIPPGHLYANLRLLFDRMDALLFELAGLAFQIQHWDRRFVYCPKCREELVPRPGERAKRCPRCSYEQFPPVVPATITLVHDGPRLLMTRSARFPPGMYGLVAGFLEPGETLETCVAREVREETGLEIDDVTYFGSQPWPFPHQVMIGFFARTVGGELCVDTRELEEARWFDRSAMPQLPPKLSIARALIDAWLARP